MMEGRLIGGRFADPVVIKKQLDQNRSLLLFKLPFTCWQMAIMIDGCAILVLVKEIDCKDLSDFLKKCVEKVEEETVDFEELIRAVNFISEIFLQLN